MLGSSLHLGGDCHKSVTIEGRLGPLKVVANYFLACAQLLD